MIPPELRERWRGSSSRPDAPQKHWPEYKHGFGLVEEGEPLFIYGHVSVWDTIRKKIDRGDEGQRKRGRAVVVWLPVWSTYTGAEYWCESVYKRTARLKVHILTDRSSLSSDSVQCANYKINVFLNWNAKRARTTHPFEELIELSVTSNVLQTSACSQKDWLPGGKSGVRV